MQTSVICEKLTPLAGSTQIFYLPGNGCSSLCRSWVSSGGGEPAAEPGSREVTTCSVPSTQAGWKAGGETQLVSVCPAAPGLI